ncbi:hypothetical protein ES703_34834 [subsurface metagenome]
MVNNYFHHAIYQSDIAPQFHGQVDISYLAELNLSRVSYYYLGTLLFCRQDPAGNQGVLLRGVGPDDENAIGLLYIGYRVGHGTTAKGWNQSSYGRGMAKAGAVVNIVSAQNRSSQFLS